MRCSVPTSMLLAAIASLACALPAHAALDPVTTATDALGAPAAAPAATDLLEEAAEPLVAPVPASSPVEVPLVEPARVAPTSPSDVTQQVSSTTGAASVASSSSTNSGTKDGGSPGTKDGGSRATELGAQESAGADGGEQGTTPQKQAASSSRSARDAAGERRGTRAAEPTISMLLAEAGVAVPDELELEDSRAERDAGASSAPTLQEPPQPNTPAMGSSRASGAGAAPAVADGSRQDAGLRPPTDGVDRADTPVAFLQSRDVIRWVPRPG